VSLLKRRSSSLAPPALGNKLKTEEHDFKRALHHVRITCLIFWPVARTEESALYRALQGKRDRASLLM